MLAYKHKYLLLEFSIYDIMVYPKTLPIPAYKKRYIKIRGPYLLRKLFELQVKYDFNILFAEGYGREILTSLLKRFSENNNFLWCFPFEPLNGFGLRQNSGLNFFNAQR